MVQVHLIKATSVYEFVYYEIKKKSCLSVNNENDYKLLMTDFVQHFKRNWNFCYCWIVDIISVLGVAKIIFVAMLYTVAVAQRFEENKEGRRTKQAIKH